MTTVQFIERHLSRYDKGEICDREFVTLVEEKFTSTNSASTKLPDFDDVYDSIIFDLPSVNDSSVQYDAVKVCYDFIAQQLRT